ncbi:hypothetical protein KKH03_03195 [Patescibacteria group bacterium]|nr:hypothetical protein [Patescibacteria group bacterium]
MTNKAKPQYFDVDKFVSEVIAEMKLGDVPAEQVELLKDRISTRLSDRIMATTLGAFKERETKLFESMLVDHPELDELDVIMIISPQIEGLKEKLEEEINSLFGELTYAASRLDNILHSSTNN